MRGSPLQATRAGRVEIRDAKTVNFAAPVVDLIAIFAAHALCYRINWNLWFGHDTVAPAIAVVAFYIVATARGLYRDLRSESPVMSFQRIWLCWAYVVPLLLGAGFVTKTLESYSRIVNVSWFVLGPLFIVLGRLSLRASLRAHVLGSQPRRVAVYGAGALGQALVSNIESAAGLGLRLTGVYDDRQQDRLQLGEPRAQMPCGNLAMLVAAAREGRLDVVYIALPLIAEARITQLIRRLQDTTASVYVACDFGRIHGAQRDWARVGHVPVMRIAFEPLPEPQRESQPARISVTAVERVERTSVVPARAGVPS